MVRPKISLVAMAVIRDAETNGISVFNIFDGVQASGLPLFLQNLSFYVLWERDLADAPDSSGHFTVSIGVHTLVTTQITVNFEDKTKHRSVVNMNGLIVPQSGELRFRIQLENGVLAEYAMDVEPPPAGVHVQMQPA